MVNLGDMSDQTRFAINSLPGQRSASEERTLRELLQQLLASLARRAINALKGISASVAEANKALEEFSKFVATVKKVLTFIAGFFKR